MSYRLSISNNGRVIRSSGPDPERATYGGWLRLSCLTLGFRKTADFAGFGRLFNSVPPEAETLLYGHEIRAELRDRLLIIDLRLQPS